MLVFRITVYSLPGPAPATRIHVLETMEGTKDAFWLTTMLYTPCLGGELVSATVMSSLVGISTTHGQD